MKAVIFTRVSSAGQEEGYSLQAQAMALQNYCTEKHLTIIHQVEAVESSTRGERRKFVAALNYVKEQKEPTALVIYTVDRLMRGYEHSGLINELIEQHNMQIHVVQTRTVIDKTSNWQEVLMFDFNVLMAKAYIGNLKDHIRKGRTEKIRQGGWNHKAPVGYKNSHHPESGKAEVKLDEERAFAVKNLFNEYATGNYSLREITIKAEQWGLTNPSTKRPYSHSSIAKMIENPFYIGLMRDKGNLHPHNAPVLVDKPLFDRCQAVKQAATTKQPKENIKYQRAKKPFVFRGLIRCGHCGRQVCSDIKKGKHIYLFCTKSGTKDFCNAERINESIALQAVESVLKRINIPEPMIQEIHVRLKAQYDEDKAEIRQYLVELQKRLDESHNKLDRLLDTLITGSITQTIYDKKRHQLEAEQENICEQITSYSKDDNEFRDSFVTLLRTVSQAAKLFKGSKVEQKRKIINFVFSNLTLNGREIHYELNRPFDKLVDLAECKEWWRIPDSNRWPPQCHWETLVNSQEQRRTSMPPEHNNNNKFFIFN